MFSQVYSSVSQPYYTLKAGPAEVKRVVRPRADKAGGRGHLMGIWFSMGQIIEILKFGHR